MKDNRKPPGDDFRKEAEHVTLKMTRDRLAAKLREFRAVKKQVDRSAAKQADGPTPPLGLSRTPPDKRAQLAELAKRVGESRERLLKAAQTQPEYVQRNAQGRSSRGRD